MHHSLPMYAWQDLPDDSVLRCFIGLWPELPQSQQLAAYAQQAQQDVGGRVMQAEHMHLTLAFMGPTTVAQLRGLMPGLSAWTCQPVQVCLNQWGVFEQAKVLWLGMDNGQEVQSCLHRWHHELWDCLQAAGWQRESRIFQPHVSLLRRVSAMVRAPSLPPIAVPVQFDRAYLIASVPEQQRSQYQILACLGQEPSERKALC